jgi:hypothetical protein
VRALPAGFWSCPHGNCWSSVSDLVLSGGSKTPTISGKRFKPQRLTQHLDLTQIACRGFECNG